MERAALRAQATTASPSPGSKDGNLSQPGGIPTVPGKTGHWWDSIRAGFRIGSKAPYARFDGSEGTRTRASAPIEVERQLHPVPGHAGEGVLQFPIPGNQGEPQ